MLKAAISVSKRINSSTTKVRKNHIQIKIINKHIQFRTGFKESSGQTLSLVQLLKKTLVFAVFWILDKEL